MKQKWKRQWRAMPLFLLLAAGVLPAWAQAPSEPPTNESGGQQSPGPSQPPPQLMVRICDDTGCSYRPKDAVSTEVVGEEAESPSIAGLRRLAQSDPKAAYDLGLRYFRGDGVRQDSYQALEWMRKAAERGDLRAQKALGGFYLFGLEEMGPDPQEAEKWISMAVSRGDKESEKLLQQARADKKTEHDDYKWRDYWRTVYYGYWHSGYPYYGVWRQTYWYGY